MNCALAERAFEELNALKSMPYRIVFWDQRACGRSGVPEGAGAPSHEQNIADLAELITELRSQGHRIGGLLGHSYGAWLVYEACRLKRLPASPLSQDGLDPLPILIGLSPQMTEPRNRSLQMDLVLLKLLFPQNYPKARDLLRDNGEEPWRVQQQIRELLPDRGGGIAFYWGNLESQKWAEQVLAELKLPENEQTHWSVRQSMYAAGPERLKGPFPEELDSPYLWINGFHDYLMQGESGLADSRMTVFMGSGHYPHIEEPEKFSITIQKFLSEHGSQGLNKKLSIGECRAEL